MKKIDVSIKNPLSIIALFVTFIDGIAGLVISVNFKYLKGEAERLPLIWFIVVFPIIVLIAFLILVVTKPQNLFGPGDFDDQELYLKAIGKNIIPNKEPKPLKKPENIPMRRNQIGICMMAFSSLKVLKQPYIKIQEAALQRYADEYDMEVKTEVLIDKTLVCDGVAEKNGELYLFEVKVSYNSAMTDNTIRNLCHISETMTNKGCTNFRIVLVLVSKKELSTETLDNLRDKANDAGLALEIVNYTRHEIEKK